MYSLGWDTRSLELTRWNLGSPVHVCVFCENYPINEDLIGSEFVFLVEDSNRVAIPVCKHHADAIEAGLVFDVIESGPTEHGANVMDIPCDNCDTLAPVRDYTVVSGDESSVYQFCRGCSKAFDLGQRSVNSEHQIVSVEAFIRFQRNSFMRLPDVA